MEYRRSRCLWPLIMLGMVLSSPASGSIVERSDVQTFITSLVSRHGFARADLARWFEQTALQPSIIKAISKPAEAKPWYAYRKIFLTEARIANGATFWQRNRTALDQAERRYGVPPEMIIAIIGIETSYGQNIGSYRVIDALSTLAFDYPRRAPFFRRELEEFLLLCRDEGISPLTPHGSYAGAMGLPQFMPSSFRQYAADGDGNGSRDIWTTPADAIASVARYFAIHGWRTGDPIATPIGVTGEGFRSFLSKDGQPKTTIEQLRRAGISAPAELQRETKAAVVSFETESGIDYWLTLHNFYVITRYNHSPLYAMAAHQLAKAIVQRHRSLAASTQSTD